MRIWSLALVLFVTTPEFARAIKAKGPLVTLCVAELMAVHSRADQIAANRAIAQLYRDILTDPQRRRRTRMVRPDAVTAEQQKVFEDAVITVCRDHNGRENSAERTMALAQWLRLDAGEAEWILRYYDLYGEFRHRSTNPRASLPTNAQSELFVDGTRLEMLQGSWARARLAPHFAWPDHPVLAGQAPIDASWLSESARREYFVSANNPVPTDAIKRAVELRDRATLQKELSVWLQAGRGWLWPLYGLQTQNWLVESLPPDRFSSLIPGPAIRISHASSGEHADGWFYSIGSDEHGPLLIIDGFLEIKANLAYVEKAAHQLQIFFRRLHECGPIVRLFEESFPKNRIRLRGANRLWTAYEIETLFGATLADDKFDDFLNLFRLHFADSFHRALFPTQPQYAAEELRVGEMLRSPLHRFQLIERFARYLSLSFFVGTAAGTEDLAFLDDQVERAVQNTLFKNHVIYTKSVAHARGGDGAGLVGPIDPRAFQFLNEQNGAIRALRQRGGYSTKFGRGGIYHVLDQIIDRLPLSSLENQRLKTRIVEETGLLASDAMNASSTKVRSRALFAHRLLLAFEILAEAYNQTLSAEDQALRISIFQLDSELGLSSLFSRFPVAEDPYLSKVPTFFDPQNGAARAFIEHGSYTTTLTSVVRQIIAELELDPPATADLEKEIFEEIGLLDHDGNRLVGAYRSGTYSSLKRILRTFEALARRYNEKHPGKPPIEIANLSTWREMQRALDRLDPYYRKARMFHHNLGGAAALHARGQYASSRGRTGTLFYFDTIIDTFELSDDEKAQAKSDLVTRFGLTARDLGAILKPKVNYEASVRVMKVIEHLISLYFTTRPGETLAFPREAYLNARGMNRLLDQWFHEGIFRGNVDSVAAAREYEAKVVRFLDEEIGAIKAVREFGGYVASRGTPGFPGLFAQFVTQLRFTPERELDVRAKIAAEEISANDGNTISGRRTNGRPAVARRLLNVYQLLVDNYNLSIQLGERPPVPLLDDTAVETYAGLTAFLDLFRTVDPYEAKVALFLDRVTGAMGPLRAMGGLTYNNGRSGLDAKVETMIRRLRVNEPHRQALRDQIYGTGTFADSPEAIRLVPRDGNKINGTDPKGQNPAGIRTLKTFELIAREHNRTLGYGGAGTPIDVDRLAEAGAMADLLVQFGLASADVMTRFTEGSARED